MLGLHFTPAWVLLSVCSLHFTPGPQSAVHSLQSAVRSLRLTTTGMEYIHRFGQEPITFISIQYLRLSQPLVLDVSCLF